MTSRIIAFVSAVSLAAAAARAETARIDVYPPDANLETSADRQQFIVVATRPDGVTDDVTAKAKITPPDAAIVRLEGNVLYPVADGQTALAVEYDGQSASIPVTVKNATASRPISFKLDVMPVFMRSGCNSGGCHGAARGKDGFAISLFGFDPDGDYVRLTREIGFRRLNLAVPEESLLVQKAVGGVPHTGGKRFDAGSEYYNTLVGWIRDGAPADPGPVPAVESIELYPPRAVLEGAEAKQPMIVRAKYADGADRDVTSLTHFYTNNDNSAPVDPSGVVKAANRGEAFVLARFETKTLGSQIIVLPAGLQYAKPTEPPANYIDELVGAKLDKLRILPGGLCSDEVFLRRATLDITGLMPTAAEYEEFMADASPDKRARLVDRLLGRKEFAEIWAMKWAELLMIKSTNQVSYKSAYLYANWLTEKIASGVPLDQMVRDMLSANGGTFDNPSTNFYQVETDTLKTTENVAQVFFGRRIQCAQCHNHPFDRWTMDDYYSFAAFFSQIGRKQGEDYRETIVFDRRGGEVNHPVGGRVMPPKFLGGAQPDLAGRDRRQVFAEWLTSPDCPDFGRNAANRIWAHFFGVGIVEPVDDVRVSNPPSNPELYDALGLKLAEYKYDFKQLVRDICASHAYQRTTERNESNREDERNFARARVRRIQAEMLLDCVSQVTETKDKFQGLPLGARAVQIADGSTSNYFLTTFGRSPRDTVCAADVRMEPTLSQALNLLNGDTLHNKIRSGGVVKRLLDEGKPPEEAVAALYVRCFARRPTEPEMTKLKALFAEAAKPQEVLEDVFWAMINSREFYFNH